MSLGKKGLTWLGLLLGLFGLVLQFALTVPAFIAQGRSVPDSLIAFFSFYTILSNLALVLVYLAALSGHSWLAVFRRPLVRAMMVAVMALVAGFFHIMLSGLYAFDGALQVANITLHYLTPALYLVWWIVMPAHGELHWRQVPLMLVPTLVYFFYILARGALITEYPYPILEVDRLGYVAVFVNALVVAALLAVLAGLVIGADHLLSRRRTPA